MKHLVVPRTKRVAVLGTRPPRAGEKPKCRPAGARGLPRLWAGPAAPKTATGLDLEVDFEVYAGVRERASSVGAGPTIWVDTFDRPLLRADRAALFRPTSTQWLPGIRPERARGIGLHQPCQGYRHEPRGDLGTRRVLANRRVPVTPGPSARVSLAADRPGSATTLGPGGFRTPARTRPQSPVGERPWPRALRKGLWL